MNMTTFLDSDGSGENNNVVISTSRMYVVYWVVVYSFGLFVLWYIIRASTRHLTTRVYGPEKDRPVWRNRYPSFEDMNALFSRGDVLMAGIMGATTLQLAHPEVARILESHSVYKTDPWRRLIRTMTFIQISIRANAAQRSQVVSWLNKLHGNIRLFAFESNVFILATIAFASARAHQVLGCVSDIEVDALIAAIMNMARTLNPNDRKKWVPTSLIEVEKYLSKQIDFKSDALENIQASAYELFGITKKGRTRRMDVTLIFHKPFSWVKLFILETLFKDVSQQILFPQKAGTSGLVLSLARMLQPMWYHLHYSACPRILTSDGLFAFFVDCDPSLKTVADEVYEEIFGRVDDGQAVPTTRKRRTQRVGPGLELSPSSFVSAVGEHFRCAYYRTRLTGKEVPQHLGIIMDGNRRYSRDNGLCSVVEGHRMGAGKLIQVISWSMSAGIHHLTVWALSDDNLKRDRRELESLFAMLAEFIGEFVTGDTPLVAQDIRFRVVGDRSLLPEELRGVILNAENSTQKNTMFNLQLALGYGGRAEVTRAVRLAAKARSLEESITVDEAVSKLSAADISRFTYSAQLGLPEIDAILRTSGEKRLSGFALWETHVAEISFVAAHWPSMKQSDFLRSIVDLSGRIRRFGA